MSGKEHEKPLSQIRLDHLALACLATQGFSLDDVPAAGVTVFLRNNANLFGDESTMQARNAEREQDTTQEHWYRDAVFYQLHVRAFCDSNEDGIGDLPGLCSKLDYLQDLGVSALWLMPFYPSPLRDAGYDIANHMDIHPAYGTLAEFDILLAEAHRRGLRVLIELVLNHTSDRHPWFQRARKAAPATAERDFYVWSDTPDRYAEARVILEGVESSNWAWDPVAGAYYLHRFHAYEPDLNYDNPLVRQEIVGVLDFWLAQGVDGFGLAAVSYLFEREGTSCENLPETHAFLRQLRGYLDRDFPGRVLIAEANAWPDEAAEYLDGDAECHMAVNFSIMPRLFMAARKEDHFPVTNIVRQTPPVSQNCQWLLFLRNHDELTLEIVTDEERDYLYRVFAADPHARARRGIRRRLAPLLSNDCRQIELMNGLLFSLPGTPVIYYGDEIGMGDNIYLDDLNSVRTPMQWSLDRNAGFSRANPQQLYLPLITHPEYRYEAINVEAQQRNPHSLLWWTKRLIALRRRLPALGRGALEFVPSSNRKVLAFVRRCQSPTATEYDEDVLVIVNLSQYLEHVELDLTQFSGRLPVEILGRTVFPAVEDHPYSFMIGPHAFHWFALRHSPAAGPGAEEVNGEAAGELLATLRYSGPWEGLFQQSARGALEAVLPGYFRPRRWFRSKARTIRFTEILDAVPIPFNDSVAYIMLVLVHYVEGDSETYLMPVTFAGPERAGHILDELPQAAIARLDGDQGGLLYDALWEPAFSATLLDAVAAGRSFEGGAGALHAEATAAFQRMRGPEDQSLHPTLGRAEQSNTSVRFDTRLIMKLFRRIEEGINPDLEITRFLTERVTFTHIPPVAGALEYRRTVPQFPGQPPSEPMTVGILQGFVANEGDAWEYTLDTLNDFIERACQSRDPAPGAKLSTQALLELATQDVPPLARAMIGDYLDSAHLLGRRTGELHVALASAPDDPNFAPEPFTLLYQRSLYQSMRAQHEQVFDLLRQRVDILPQEAQTDAEELLAREDQLLARLDALKRRKTSAMRIRTHGDYHLGQVLYTGDDFVIIDFEGEPARPLSEGRFKRGALRDVAGMLRSFQYASYVKSLFNEDATGYRDTAETATVDAWGRFWQLWVCASYLRGYLGTAGEANFLPREEAELRLLLDAYLVEKAVYELGYELNNRPDWVIVPLRGLLSLIES